MYVQIFYDRCSKCNKEFNHRLVANRNAFRVGAEMFRCKCGAIYRTGRVEWDHLKSEWKWKFFLPWKEIAVVVAFVAAMMAMAYFVEDIKNTPRPVRLREMAEIVVPWTAGYIVLRLLMKAGFVMNSKRRMKAERQMPEGDAAFHEALREGAEQSKLASQGK